MFINATVVNVHKRKAAKDVNEFKTKLKHRAKGAIREGARPKVAARFFYPDLGGFRAKDKWPGLWPAPVAPWTQRLVVCRPPTESMKNSKWEYACKLKDHSERLAAAECAANFLCIVHAPNKTGDTHYRVALELVQTFCGHLPEAARVGKQREFTRLLLSSDKTFVAKDACEDVTRLLSGGPEEPSCVSSPPVEHKHEGLAASPAYEFQQDDTGLGQGPFLSALDGGYDDHMEIGDMSPLAFQNRHLEDWRADAFLPPFDPPIAANEMEQTHAIHETHNAEEVRLRLNRMYEFMSFLNDAQAIFAAAQNAIDYLQTQITHNGIPFKRLNLPHDRRDPVTDELLSLETAVEGLGTFFTRVYLPCLLKSLNLVDQVLRDIQYFALQQQ